MSFQFSDKNSSKYGQFFISSKMERTFFCKFL